MPEESTTPDLVENVRALSGTEASAYRDGLLSYLAPDATFHVSALGTTFEGIAAIRGFLTDWMDAYDQWQLDVEEARDLGGGIVFVVWIQTGRPVGSSGELQYRFAQVLTLANGKIVRISGYPNENIDEARAAAERLAEERG